MITSQTNQLLKTVRSLHQKKGRQEQQLFLAEGIHLVQEALRAGIRPEFFLWTAKLSEDPEGAVLLERLSGSARGYEVDERIFASAAETETPQGILAVLPLPSQPCPDWAGVKLGLVVDGIQDPGNLGTILRIAWSAGIDQLILTPGTADPFQGKVVRSSMGAIFNFTPLTNLAPRTIARSAADHGLQIVAGDLRAAEYCFQIDLTVPTLLLVGNEGRGIDPDWENFAIKKALIPQPGKAESLNVAVSAGILVYETVRQRLNMDTCKSKRALI